VPITNWEVDCNFKQGGIFASGWCWDSISEWNTAAFPAGAQLSSLLGNASMTFYVSSFCNKTSHRKDFRFVELEPPAYVPTRVRLAAVHPDDARAFYTSVLAPLQAQANMRHLFTDFMCYRGPAVAAALPHYFEAER